MSKHIATIAAYPIRDELGGGFRGVMLIHPTKERRASDRLDTLEQARYWAQKQAEDTYSDLGYALAPLRRKGEYQANVWIAA